jgi:hypothetical protein
LFVERFGLRHRFASSFAGSFESLRERYYTHYLTLTEAARQAISAELTDIGGPLNFKDKHGNFNTMSGPMRADQLKEFFARESEYPEVSLYFDIDYWLKPNKEVSGDDILRMIKTLSQEGWTRHDRIRSLVLEG